MTVLEYYLKENPRCREHKLRADIELGRIYCETCRGALRHA